MKEAASVVAGKLISDASVFSAHMSPSPVAAGAPLNPRYCTYLVGYVSVAPPTVQVMSFFLEKVFDEFEPAMPPTMADLVSVLLSKLVDRLPLV